MAVHTVPRTTNERRRKSFFTRRRDAFLTEWKAFTAAPPGKRFQDRYQRNLATDRPAWQKIVSPLIGVAIVLLGLCLLPAPGPGIPIVLFGLALVAEHFLWAAKVLDRCEPPLRSLMRTFFKWWKVTSAIKRWGAVAFAVILLSAATASTYLLLN